MAEPDKNNANDNDVAPLGASDGTNGGGSATGIPDGDTGLTVGDIAHDQNVQHDREKLFPGSSPAQKKESSAS